MLRYCNKVSINFLFYMEYRIAKRAIARVLANHVSIRLRIILILNLFLVFPFFLIRYLAANKIETISNKSFTGLRSLQIL